jgi:large subunit ribosomal protein L23
MAIFEKKATAKAEPKKKVTETKVAVVSTLPKKEGKEIDLAMVLIRPHVTEKASDLSEKGVYVFEINKLANKMHVRMAVEKIFKVKPVKIAVTLGAGKLMRNRNNNRVQIKKQVIKKAFVYLKEGDKIEFV